MTADDFRDMALTMQDAAERAHMGHPDFRAGGRIFSSLTSDEQVGTVKLTPEEQREFMTMSPGVFAPASGAWGREGWTTIRLAAADPAAVRGALILAWHNVVQGAKDAKGEPKRGGAGSKHAAARRRGQKTSATRKAGPRKRPRGT